MELTHLFEQISGSDAFKKQYEELQQLQSRAEEKVAVVVGKKRTTAAEKRQKKEQKEEAEKHLAKQQQLVSLAERGATRSRFRKIRYISLVDSSTESTISLFPSPRQRTIKADLLLFQLYHLHIEREAIKKALRKKRQEEEAVRDGGERSGSKQMSLPG